MKNQVFILSATSNPTFSASTTDSVRAQFDIIAIPSKFFYYLGIHHINLSFFQLEKYWLYEELSKKRSRPFCTF